MQPLQETLDWWVTDETDEEADGDGQDAESNGYRPVPSVETGNLEYDDNLYDDLC